MTFQRDPVSNSPSSSNITEKSLFQTDASSFMITSLPEFLSESVFKSADVSLVHSVIERNLSLVKVQLDCESLHTLLYCDSLTTSSSVFIILMV